jgi:hypothetical protein
MTSRLVALAGTASVTALVVVLFGLAVPAARVSCAGVSEPTGSRCAHPGAPVTISVLDTGEPVTSAVSTVARSTR